MAAEAQEMAQELINQTQAIDESTLEDFNQELLEDDSKSLYVDDTKVEDLKTHNRIRANLCGTILELIPGQAKTTLQTIDSMSVDDLGLVHSGFIFGAADYAAAAAINEENVVIIGSRSKFLAPAKVNDLIEFEAKAKFEDSRKREIRVNGYINDIKVFEGTFQAVVLEHHILKTNIKHLHREHSSR